MLLFYGTSPVRLPRLRQYGANDAVLWRTWEHARRVGDGVILVVARADLDQLTDHGGPALHARHVPPDAFRNLSPYHPAAAIVAAGGVVLRPRVRPPEVLLIMRNGRWDLPKGKQDEGERLLACAAREVMEETGATDLQTGACIGATMHGYVEKGTYYVKYTYWYLMHSSTGTFAPQMSEGITEVRWALWERATEILGYETLRQLLQGISPLAHVDSASLERR